MHVQSLESSTRPLIAGNWKMHGLGPQLRQIDEIAAVGEGLAVHLDVLICVPATLLFRASKVAAGRIGIGGEDCSPQVEGAFTGDVSALMLKDAGATTVIVGHSERRMHHCETDALVSLKAKAALAAGLSTIICIGETQAQRRSGATLSACQDQLEKSLPECPAGSRITVAYEPIWAIGSRETPTHDEITTVHSHIRSFLEGKLQEAARNIRIIYGGSVDRTNARGILDLPDVGGVLIGGASLLSVDFVAVLESAVL